MATQLVYLTDTYNLSHLAQLQAIATDERGSYCVLDSTVFYPQGGGQPSDTGVIEIKGVTVLISFVSFGDGGDGDVRHYGDFSQVTVARGDRASLQVDAKNRLRNAKAHTAGHLLAAAAEALKPELVAVKGYHFPDGSYIEFEGTLPPEKREEFVSQVNARLQQQLALGSKITTEFVTLDAIQARCSRVPLHLPSDKPLRVMAIGDAPPTLCGGTHLKSLKELKAVQVTKVKSQKGRLKVSYRAH